ncbi:MAG TPA: guanitoxin biosynthesis heme-dependent pre-guanitoxin N-hydroxylase GntA [Longimicrobium sp.]|nr:guanitoxin biosynthesis heme-dependent pre-guanitoxin N-hydroxylase GntA [Longimicrobium sp.]
MTAPARRVRPARASARMHAAPSRIDAASAGADSDSSRMGSASAGMDAPSPTHTAPPIVAAPAGLRALAARVRERFEAFVNDPAFSCLGARAALHHDAYRFGAYGKIGSGEATAALARDLAAFAREEGASEFATFVAAFVDVAPDSEHDFEARLWAQLQALHAADPGPGWDAAVSDDPADPAFSFSFAGRAFFIVGLHPESSRLARRFGWPVLVFNPHAQFQRLRADGRYGRLRETIRARELALQGSLNPNLAEFGEESEARQYSGRATGGEWACPFHRLSAGDAAGARAPAEDASFRRPSPSTPPGR